MGTKYQTNSIGMCDPIRAVEVERETEASVWVNGRRCAKRADYHNYFDTWEEAKAFLVEEAERALTGAHRRLDAARSELERMKAIKL